MRYRFGDYTLDLQRQELWRGDTSIPLRRKAFELLICLLEHADRLISREELVSQVWSRRFIDDATLNSCLREVRRAVGDNGRAQRVIATIRGRGYRVIIPVHVQVGTASELTPDAIAEPLAEGTQPLPTRLAADLSSVMVGRGTELRQMQRYFTDACRGRRQTVFVTGEPGIGK